MASATSILNLEMATFISFGCGYQRRGIPIFFSVLKINLKRLAFLRLGMVALPMTPEPGADWSRAISRLRLLSRTHL